MSIEKIKVNKADSVENTEKQGFLEINKEAYDKMENTIRNIQHAWMSDKSIIDGEKQGNTEQQVCSFEAKSKEILINLMKEKGVNITKGYNKIVDNIVGCSNPNSPEYKNMHREYKKFLGIEFSKEYRKRLDEELGAPAGGKDKFGNPKRCYIKNGQEVIDQSTIDLYKKELNLHNPEYQLGFGLEESLGGKSVQIKTEIQPLMSPANVYVTIREDIGYNEDAKQFYIKPETKIKDIVEKLESDKIPTISSIDK